MYECPNCGSNLKFDIASQQMLCSYCSTTVDPYSIQSDHDAEESREYDVTIFTCSQCGAELLSEDTTAATFCSFCGSTAILDSRIGKGHRPVHIIPFSKTKEDCKASYAKMMRRAIFAPKELKDEENIEKFRGIYMPYWVYSFEKKGQITFRGSESRQKGDYLITKHYDIVSDVDAAYEGISYDAAASFSDDLSGAISPYDMKSGKPFTPSYLSGFYADVSDVDSSVYEQEAEELAVEDCFSKLANDSICSRYHVKDQKNAYSLRNALRPKCTAAESAMFPVWFLSYRKGDRVAYAVVNGQTGKAAADLPVDRRKYVIGSLLLAIPLFIILNLRFTIRPNVALILSALLAFVCALISFSQMSRIREKETRENDRGYVYSKQENSRHANKTGVDDSWVNYAEIGQRKPSKKSGSSIKILQIMIGAMIFTFVMPFVMVFVAFRGGNAVALTAVFIIFFVLAYIISTDRLQQSIQKGSFKESLPVLVKPGAAILLSIVIIIWNPVSDLYYYGGAVISMGAVIWTLMDIIGRYNMLTTRRLPQFNRWGGDENA
ncbi:MAG: hypothetical protein HDR04_15675 [Lachnospiraceae bacterium]|nr:hypothetical protein [Lachnospiraceae bacterium]